MKYASSDYAANMSGSSYVRQFLNKEKRKPKEKAESDQDVNMNCSADHGCSAFDSGGGVSNAGSSSYKEGSTSSGTGGEKNEVLTKKQAEKRAKEFEKNRQKAPAMKNLTKNQKEALEETRPSRAVMYKENKKK